MDALSVNEIKVLMNEVNNDGSSAHLYYSPSLGSYVAYGISAYIIFKMEVGMKPSYSHNLQMPMVVVRNNQIDILKKKMESINSIENEYMLFETSKKYDDENYDEWAGNICSQFVGDK